MKNQPIENNNNNINLIYASLALFFSLNYEYLKLVRIFPEKSPASSCYVCSNDNQIALPLNLKSLNKTKELQNNTYTLIQYIIDKEFTKKQPKTSTDKIANDEMMYKKVIKLINQYSTKKSSIKNLFAARLFANDTMYNIDENYYLSDDEYDSFDLAFSIYDFVFKHYGDRVTDADLKNFFKQYFVEKEEDINNFEKQYDQEFSSNETLNDDCDDEDLDKKNDEFGF